MSTATGGTSFGALGQGPLPTGASSSPAAPTFEVDVPLLTAEGRALQEIGGQLPREAVKLFEPADTAVAGLVGWRTAAALEQCTEAWVALLKCLSAGLDSAGADMTATAKNYQSAEAAARQHLAQLGQGPMGKFLEMP